MWYPHGASDDHFVRMALNVGKAICLSAEMLQQARPGVKFVHVDTCESHYASDRRSEEWVRFANERRFVMHDLVLGRIGKDHPLYAYMKKHGASDDALDWMIDHRMRFDVLGLDYYFHSEIEWYWDRELGRANISYPCSVPRGFALVARDYVERFDLPVILTETNIRGTITDRLTWLKHMEEQVEALAESGADVRGFCWYPSIDSTDWCHCCTQCTNSVDPQGIWWLDQARWTRHASVLSENYSKLAKGEITSRDLPAYMLSPEVRRDLRGYMKFMNHWTEWIERDDVGKVA
jgi:beta-glucosidase/6-phospho-beta-glucosidase/beta-galactosidase